MAEMEKNDMNKAFICVLAVLVSGCMSGGVKRVGHNYLLVDAGVSNIGRPGITMGRLLHCQSPIYIKTVETPVKNQKGETVDYESYTGPYCDRPTVVDDVQVGAAPITGEVLKGALIGGGIAAGGYLLRPKADKTNVQNGSSSESSAKSRSHSSSMSTSGMRGGHRD